MEPGSEATEGGSSTLDSGAKASTGEGGSGGGGGGGESLLESQSLGDRGLTAEGLGGLRGAGGGTAGIEGVGVVGGG